VSDRAHSKRLARLLEDLQRIADPLARLDAVRESREALDELEAATVAQARKDGVTWGAIGSLYGLTKQGAQQRFQPARKAKATSSKSA
jgi:hypothetical protein